MKKTILSILSLFLLCILCILYIGCQQQDEQQKEQPQETEPSEPIYLGYDDRYVSGGDVLKGYFRTDVDYELPYYTSHGIMNCYTRIAYDEFVKKYPSLPDHFIPLDLLSQWGELMLLEVKADADQSTFTYQTLFDYTYTLKDGNGNIIQLHVRHCPDGLPETNVDALSAELILNKENIRYLSEHHQPGVIYLDGIRYHYGTRHTGLTAIEWQYQDIWLSFEMLNTVNENHNNPLLVNSLLQNHTQTVTVLTEFIDAIFDKEEAN